MLGLECGGTHAQVNRGCRIFHERNHEDEAGTCHAVELAEAQHHGAFPLEHHVHAAEEDGSAQHAYDAPCRLLRKEGNGRECSRHRKRDDPAQKPGAETAGRRIFEDFIDLGDLRLFVQFFIFGFALVLAHVLSILPLARSSPDQCRPCTGAAQPCNRSSLLPSRSSSSHLLEACFHTQKHVLRRDAGLLRHPNQFLDDQINR